MTRDQLTTGIRKAVRLADVPAAKWGVMVQRTVLGVLFAGLGVYLARTGDGIRLYLGLAGVVVGATIWSTQLVVGALKALLEPFRAYRRAFKGDPDA